MTDYTMVKNAIEVAEKAYVGYKNNSDMIVESKSANILHQVCDYLHTVLINSGGFSADLVVGKWGTRTNEVLGEIRFTSFAPSSGNGFLIDYDNKRIKCNAQLFIEANHSVCRVYFNQNGYYIDTDINRVTLEVLVVYWATLKTKLDPTIDEYFAKRIQTAKEKLNQLEKSNAIINNFKL